MSRRAAAGALVALLALSCRSLPATSPAGGSTGTVPLQVVHRAARSASGALTPAAAAGLADGAALAAFPEQLPLDAWAAIARGRGPIVLIAEPPGGAIAEAVVDRLRAAAAGRLVVVCDSPADIEAKELREAAVVLVVSPAWTDGAVAPDPQRVAAEIAQRGGARPRLVVADLTTVQIGQETWPADQIVAGTDPARVGLVTEFVLAARAARALPDAAAIAKRRGLPEEAAHWEVAVIAD